MNKKLTISVVIIVKNEETKIEDCLKSVKWADEIVVVDDGSTDNTVQISKKYTNKVYPHKSAGYVEPARNFAISKASGDWILVLDADERIPESLATQLREISDTKIQAIGVDIPRKNIIFGKWIEHSGWWPDYQMRFFKRGSVSWSDEIHRQPVLNGERVQLDAKPELSIHHLNYKSVYEFIDKLNRYTEVEAREFIKLNKSFNWIEIITKPFSEFLSRFFARGGYKDGLHGLVLAILQAISMFVVSIKVWELKNFEEIPLNELLRETEKEAHKMHRDILFWFTHKKISEIKNPLKKNAYRLLRKFSR